MIEKKPTEEMEESEAVSTDTLELYERKKGRKWNKAVE